MLHRTRRQIQLICICGLLITMTVVFVLSLCNKSCNTNEQNQLAQHERENTDLKRVESKQYTVVTNLLIVVLSAPKNFKERNTVRETWGAQQRIEGIACVRFIIGDMNLPNELTEHLQKENETFGDLIFLPIKDSFDILTKKLLETFKYAYDSIKFNYLMKVDEDTFVRVQEVVRELNEQRGVERLYWGFFDGRASIKRSGKWKEPSYVLCDRYIPYALGGGYVLSLSLVEYVAKNKDYFQLFRNEDASLGTWLGPLDIYRKHDARFDTEFKSRGCYNSYIVTHKKTTDQMYELQHNLDTTGKLCSVEHRVRLSYEYNWTSPPSQCCERKDKMIP